MEFYNLDMRIVQLNNVNEVKQIEGFLEEHDLRLDKDVEYTVALLYDENIAATGSIASNVLKCFAVDSKYRGEGLLNKVASHLINEQYRRGRTHLFVYTKSSNYQFFQDLGFYKIMEIPPKVMLLENDPKGLKKYIGKLEKHKVQGNNISSIVMNGNPFTLGHLHLIERASCLSNIVHVFVVWEEQSVFPSQIRYELIKKGTQHLSNVFIHKGEHYIISSATFPSYFIKGEKEVANTHASLDLNIFGKYIAPAVGIQKRFVGEEPYCEVTKIYNEKMKEILPTYGIEVIEIPRLKIGDAPISASRVRMLLKEDKFTEIREIVPKSTYDFLTSSQGQPIIKAIKQKESRH